MMENLDFQEIVRLSVSVPSECVDQFYKNMIDRTDGRIIPVRGETVLAAFEIVSEKE